MQFSRERDQVSALSKQLEASSSGSDAATSHTSMWTELEAARRALHKYERVLGPNPEVADDIRHLGDRIAQSDKERATLELKLSEAEAVSIMILDLVATS